MGTHSNRLNEAVLMCTHNQCFRAKKENIIRKLKFYSREILLYIAWAHLNIEVKDGGTVLTADAAIFELEWEAAVTYYKNYPQKFGQDKI